MANSIEIIAANIPITVAKGATLNWTTTIQIDGTPVDLTDGSIISVVIEEATTEINKLEISSDGVDPQIALDDSGNAAVSITDAQTAALGVGSYYYALWWTNADSEKRPIHAGWFTVTKPGT